MARRASRGKAKIDYRVQGLTDLTDKLRALHVDLRRVLPGALLAGAEVIRARAEPDAPGPHVYAVPVARLERDAVAAAVGPDKEHWYYAFAEFGARPHAIGPQRRKALAFEGLVVKGVEHPGAPRRPFLRPALDHGWRDAVKAMRGELWKALRAICE